MKPPPFNNKKASLNRSHVYRSNSLYLKNNKKTKDPHPFSPPQAGILPPLIAILVATEGLYGDPAALPGSTEKTKAAHTSALAMELLVLLAAHPQLVGQLRAAGTIIAIAVCLDDPAGATDGGGESGSGNRSGASATRSHAALIQSALTVSTSLLRGCATQREGESLFF